MTDLLRSNVLNFALFAIALLIALLASKGLPQQATRRVAVVVLLLFIAGLAASGRADDVSGWLVSSLIGLFAGRPANG